MNTPGQSLLNWTEHRSPNSLQKSFRENSRTGQKEPGRQHGDFHPCRGLQMVPHLVKAEGGGDEREKDQGRMAVEKGDGRHERLNSCNPGLHQGEHRIISSFFPVYFTFSIPFSDTAGGHKQGNAP
ncbi:MAG: hypothetical protein CW342_09780 [Thermoactinomycetaceae bacterium]|nr:hypothetical protein [Thermoactinomycetaceae bacterium]